VTGRVVAVSRRPTHRLAKDPASEIRLLAGLGVEGDAHAGETVQHRSRKRWNPELPNLRQVHLIAGELFDELNERGFDVAPGQLGENVTTRGVDLLALAAGARLRLGGEAVVEVTGLRNPCVQLDRFRDGLMEATLEREAGGTLRRRAGVMGIVIAGGQVRPGDPITVELPAAPHVPLEPV
jgi:MOSC domain-containing protein YiiM